MIPFLLLIMCCTLAGSCIGTLTGLIPGLHVNTVALLLVAGNAAITAMLIRWDCIPYYQIPLLIAVIITSTSITHTFVDFIPSTFLGVPDPDTALSVLPAHTLLLEGEGFRAVHLSAVGSAIAITLGAVIFLPYSWLLGSPLNGYSLLRENILYLLFFLTCFLICSEETKIRDSNTLGKIVAFLVFILSGILGLVALPLPSSSPFGLFSTVLFPLFSGLFGLSTLILSLNDTSTETIPLQRISSVNIGSAELKAGIPGGIAGSIVGFLPGVSSAHASLVAMKSGRNKEEDSNELVIVTMGAVNTANAMFVLIALFLTGNARSGAAVAIQEFIPSTEWNELIPYHLIILLISVFLSSLIAYHVTLTFGRIAASEIKRVPYEKLIIGIIVFVGVLVFLFNGFLGLFILFVATCAGILPPLLGVRRSHLMGVLLVPVIFFFW